MLRKKKYRWEIITSIERKKRGMIVMLDSLVKTPKTQKTSKSKTSRSEEDLKPLLQKLELVFKSRKNNDAFDAYTKFISLRKNKMSMSDYITEYKRLYSRMVKYDMVLPEAVLVFKLLEGANLKAKQRKLALALGNDLKLKTMKFLLKRLFAKHSSGSETTSTNGKPDETTSTNGKPDDRYDYTSSDSAQCGHSQSSPVVSDDDRKDGFDQVAIIHLTEEKFEKFEILVEEANSAVINTRCTETVAGEKWFENYTKKLSPLQQRGVDTYPSNATFRFSGRSKVIASKTAVFPVKVGTNICKLEAEILEAAIPLLLGKTCLKKAGTVIDIENDKVKMFGNEVALQTSVSGLYYFNIFPKQVYNEYFYRNGALEASAAYTCSQKKKIIELHNQYGHATAGNLRRLVRNAGIMTNKLNSIIEDVVSECDTCTIIGLSESDDFNKRVFVGFHQLQPTIWYMQIIDEYTRFSNAAIIRNKQAVVRIFLKCWLCIFGAPEEIMTDKGNEFTGEDFLEMCSTFDIKVSVTPSSAPWSSGVCERHNQTLTDIHSEIQADNRCDCETALLWAISAKNAIINHNGLSPAQLVFGQAGTRSTRLSEKQATFRESLHSSIGLTVDDLSTLHMARAALDDVRAKGKGRRPKKETEKPLNQGEEEMRYKGDWTPQWNGPSKVLVPVLLLRKGSEYVKAYVCRVQSSVDNKTCDKTQNGCVKERHYENDVVNTVREELGRGEEEIMRNDKSNETSSNEDEHDEHSNIPEEHDRYQ